MLTQTEQVFRAWVDYVRCYSAYVRCYSAYVRCYSAYVRCYSAYVRCYSAYVRCYIAYEGKSKARYQRAATLKIETNFLTFGDTDASGLL